MASAVTMDFFQNQDAARRRTGLLVFYYILAVICIMLAVYLAFVFTFIGIDAKTKDAVDLSKLWNPTLFVWVMGITAGIVLMGTAYKVSQLSGGGQSVAEMLGGKPINRNTRDVNERKVLNVVEEMAIASGTSVPRVFVLSEEKGINAFAAGFSPGDAVIGVTRGCIEQLNRDELQGVIAHEFSHILNGDMRLNIRLIGTLHGILLIGLMGYLIFRSTLYSRSSSRDRGNKMPIVLLGLIIWVIGYVGVFFGKLIKSAVSRQREFLADASAVQFTRNPDGIAGALKKIGGWKKGSKLESPNAEQASHFFFSNGLTSSLFNLMATHPPLKERIRRLDPSFSGVVAGSRGGGAAATSSAAAGVSGFSSGASRIDIHPDDVMASVGAPSPEHIAYASSLLSALPDQVSEAAREPFGARALIYGLLLNREKEPRDLQLQRLKEYADPVVYQETMRLLPMLSDMSAEARLPVAEMAMSSLREMSLAQYEAFEENVSQLVAADEQIDLFEFTLNRMIKRHVEPSFRKAKRDKMRYGCIADAAEPAKTLLSCLAYWGTDDMSEALRAYEAGVKKLGLVQAPEISKPAECGLPAIEKSLNELMLSLSAIKKLVLDACVTCIGVDGKVTLEEAELVRAVADSLDCPMPPFLPGAQSN